MNILANYTFFYEVR
jgi:hypothetical protein